MKVCIIGLGRFGYNIATTLHEKGIEVLAIDSNESIVSSIRDSVTQSICMRVLDETALRSVGVDEMDTVIVAMGENFAQSILITAILKKHLKIPRVITRTINEIHQEIVTIIGADETIIPEQDVGVRLAERLSSPFSQFFRITKDFSLSQITAPEDFIGKTIASLALQETYQVGCIAKKEGAEFISIGSDYIIKKDDVLLFSGNVKELNKLARL